MKQPTCYLIGEDHLLIQCGEILLAKNYNIKGIFSPLKEAKIWAEENKIQCFDSFKDTETFLTQNKIDYLFSIVNSYIIYEKILKNVKRIAINYHDGPLPRYGGANATSFAIINNEKKHGITWHVINNLIDGGEILIQSIFDIEPEETTFTLNVKCYQHGLKTFENLILSLHDSAHLKTKQNLDSRLYNNLNKKPLYNGFVDWDFSADYLERSIRSYTVGNYKNKFSTLKFKIGDKAYIIRDLKNTHKKSTKQAGCLLELSSEQLKIATATCDIIIYGIRDIYGEEISVSTLNKNQFGSACNGVKINKIWAMTDGMGVNILWDATTDLICETIPKNEMYTQSYNEFGGIPNNAGTGVTGNVAFSTVGATSGSRYTIILEVIKTYASIS